MTIFQSSTPSLHYRPEIDGLRAIAIIAVVGFHLFPELIKGGFVGVDVFFVISGFLISSILFKEMDNKHFSFINFYARRIKRLFPALIIVFLIFYIYGWFVLLGDEFALLGKHIYYGSSFLANVALWKEAGYFDVAGGSKPFLHLWSLSIEEQYYLIWPLLLYCFAKTKQKKYMGWFILLLCVISFAINASFAMDILFQKKLPTLTFYTPPARFWELMIGSALAYISYFKSTALNVQFNVLQNKCIRWNVISPQNLCSFIGFCLIFIAIAKFDSNNLYPGALALLPTVGAFLIILAGNSSWFSKKILSNRHLVFIGLISYPLYLLHWPFIAFVKIIHPSSFNLTSVKMTILIISVFLSFVIYRWLEKPIRLSSNKVTLFLVIVMLALGMHAHKSYKKEFLPSIAKKPEAQQVMQALGDWEYPGKLIPFKFKGFTFYKQASGQETVLFMGDSNLQQYAPRITRLFEEKNKRLKSAIFATKPSWPPIPNLYSPNYPAYKGMMDAVLALTQDPKVTDVVIGANWFGYTTSQTLYYHEKNGVHHDLNKGSIGLTEAFDDLKQMIQTMVSHGKRVYLISNMPTGGEYDPKSRFVERDFFGRWKFDSKQGNKAAWMAYSKDLKSLLQTIAKESGATFLNPEDFLCNNSECTVSTDRGDPIYMDGAHLRPGYVKDNVTFLDPILLKD
jgi:peptidoglycan/LPS O-acetylase OafA/YrhL